MIYEVGMLCKHFKGKNLLQKNIYRIIGLGIRGTEIDSKTITYTGNGILEEATDLVVYQNIFQNDKYFAREYADISSELSLEKQEEFHQKIRVQPLNEQEIMIVSNDEFIAKKFAMEEEKHRGQIR